MTTDYNEKRRHPFGIFEKGMGVISAFLLGLGGAQNCGAGGTGYSPDKRRVCRGFPQKFLENTSLYLFVSCLKAYFRKLFYNGYPTPNSKKVNVAWTCPKSSM